MDARPDADPPPFTTQTRRIFQAFRDLTAEHGVPATLTEVGGWLAISTPTVSEHRRRLRKLGLVDYDERRRSTRVTTDPELLAHYGLGPAQPSSHAAATTPAAPLNRQLRAGFGGKNAGWRRFGPLASQPSVLWPLSAQPPHRLLVVGSIAAGRVTAFNRFDPTDETLEVLEVEPELATPGRYALRVTGDSLIDLGIFDGDHVVIDPEQPCQKGDLVVALLPGEDNDEGGATVKVFSPDQGRHWLLAANSEYPPIPLWETRVLGRVTAVVRRL